MNVPADAAGSEEVQELLRRSSTEVKPIVLKHAWPRLGSHDRDGSRTTRECRPSSGWRDRYLGEIGYTEHGFRHAGLVSHIAFNVLNRLGYEDRMKELGAIAGYLHDMGNFVSRSMHSQTGATITYDILKDLGMTYTEIGVVMAAIGSHEEEFGHPVNPVGAALIVADKSDVHRSRVRIKDPALFDIHSV